MTSRTAKVWILPLLIAAATTLLLAQDWQTATTLTGVDFTGLTPVRKTRALQALRTMDCACGCEMKVAECRVKDPACVFSKGISASIVGAVKEGKTAAAAIEVAKASKFGHREPPKLLEDAVQIPIQGSPVTGAANARVTLVEFSDFQCPFCGPGSLKLAAVLKAFPEDVKLVFKQYPLNTHPQAQISAQAALSAHQQGKFWQLHDLMFANRATLSRQAIVGWAGQIGLDMKRFNADLDSEAIKKAVTRDMEDAEKAGVEATPTVFINGQKYNGELGLDAIRPVIEGELKKVKK